MITILKTFSEHDETLGDVNDGLNASSHTQQQRGGGL
jgi:hypothetical protein